MAVEKNAIATLSELLIERVSNLIIENEEELLNIRDKSQIQGAIPHTSKYYRPNKQAKDRIKQLSRDLGALLTTNVKDQETLIKQLEKLDLINNPGQLGDTLSKFLKAREGKEIYYKVGRDMTVGHHPTATNLLREALSGSLEYYDAGLIIVVQIYNPKFDQKTRQELIEIAKKNKYNLGDSAIAYIDPGSHKEFTSKLNGILGKRGIDPNSKQGQLFVELFQRSAHARAFGGTTGIPIPESLFKKGMSPDQLFEIAKPYLDLAKAGTAQGLDMHSLLRNTDWSNPEDLLKVIREAKVPNTDSILQRIYKQQVNAGIEPSGRLIGAFTDPSELLDIHKPKWSQLNKGVKLDNIGTVNIEKLQDLDLTPGLQSPTNKLGSGSTDKIWQPSGIFNFDGGGAAVGVLDRPGLFSGVISDFMNADKGISNITNTISSKYNKWILTGGPQRQLSKLARDQYLNVPLTYVFSPEFRENIKQGNYGAAGTQLAVDEAIGRTTWEVGKRVWGSAYAAAPTATTIGSVGLLTGVVGWFQNMADQKVRDKIDPFFTGAFSTGMSFIGGSQLRF